MTQATNDKYFKQGLYITKMLEMTLTNVKIYLITSNIIRKLSNFEVDNS